MRCPRCRAECSTLNLVVRYQSKHVPGEVCMYVSQGILAIIESPPPPAPPHYLSPPTSATSSNTAQAQQSSEQPHHELAPQQEEYLGQGWEEIRKNVARVEVALLVACGLGSRRTTSASGRLPSRNQQCGKVFTYNRAETMQQ